MIFWKYLLPIHKFRKKTTGFKKFSEFENFKNNFSFFKNISTFYFENILKINTKITSN